MTFVAVIVMYGESTERATSCRAAASVVDYARQTRYPRMPNAQEV